MTRRLAFACILALLAPGLSSSAEPQQQPPKYFLMLLETGPGIDKTVSLHEQKGFPAHMAYMKQLESSGKLLLGGPLVDDFTHMNTTGAMLIVRADTAEEARAIAAGDPSGFLAVKDVRAFVFALGHPR